MYRLLLNLCFQSLYSPAGIQKADLSCEGDNLRCLYGNFQTNLHPNLQRSLSLLARVPKPPVSVEGEFFKKGDN